MEKIIEKFTISKNKIKNHFELTRQLKNPKNNLWKPKNNFRKPKKI